MENEGTVVRFVKRIVRLEAQCDQLKAEKIQLEEQVMEAKRKEEEEESIREKLRQVGVEKRELEIHLKAAKSLLEDKDGIITTLLAKNETLKMAMEDEKQKVEEGKVLELSQKIEVLEEEKGQMEAEYCKVKNEAEKIFSVRKAFEAEKKRFEKARKAFKAQKKRLAKARKKINEVVKRVDALDKVKEAEKVVMEEEGKTKVSELFQRIEELVREKGAIEANVCQANKEKSEEMEKKLKAAEAEAQALTGILEEKDSTISTLLTKTESLERHNSRLQIDFEAKMAMEADKHKVEEEKTLVLTQKIQVLEAEFCKVKEDNMTGAERIRNLNKEIVKRIGVLEDAEKRDSELTCRIQVLEREKRELEVEVCEVKRRKSEEIKRLLNETTTLKEKHTQDILSLVMRSGVLEREKARLEADTREREERIKLLLQEKKHLVDKIKKLEIDMNESKKNVKLPQQVHPATNVDVSSTPTAQKEGAETQKRKVQGLGCSAAKQARTKRGKLDGLPKHNSKPNKT